MAHEQRKVLRTNTEVLAAYLRIEVGELITTWILLRRIRRSAASLQTTDVAKDMQSQDLTVLHLICDKLRNDIIARLSELAEKEVTQTTFYLASKKLKCLDEVVSKFGNYVSTQRIRDKRNQEIAHRKQAMDWPSVGPIRIRDRVLTRGIAMSIRLMKRIDRLVLGPSSPFLWARARSKRYELSAPAGVNYMLLPHLNLAAQDRITIARLEEAEGTVLWSWMETVVNGQPAKLRCCKKWGLIEIHGRTVALPQYPLLQLDSINLGEPTSWRLVGWASAHRLPHARDRWAEAHPTHAIRTARRSGAAGMPLEAWR